jgi:hypothetical protein
MGLTTCSETAEDHQSRTVQDEVLFDGQCQRLTFESEHSQATRLGE